MKFRAASLAVPAHPRLPSRSETDAFDNLVAMLLRRDGYWTDLSVKVELSREEKAAIGRTSSPRSSRR